MRLSLGRSVGGDIDGPSWTQAGCGVRDGGLNWRTASDLALPAFLASRIASQPAAFSIFDDLASAGLGSAQEYKSAYITRTNNAQTRLQHSLPDDVRQAVVATIDDGSQAARDQWSNLLSGQGEPRAPPDGGMQPGAGLIADADDSSSVAHVVGAPKLQRALFGLIDEARLRRLGALLHSEGRDSDVRRIRELRSKEQDPSWIWSINKVTGPTLEPLHHSVAVRAMLGADFLFSPMLCHGCSSRMLDVQGCHALCCLGGASTVGHNKVRDVVALGVAVVDPATVTEAPGLAIDVGIASPKASGAGDDCVEAMSLAKRAHYGPAVPDEFHAVGIIYVLAHTSCFGRRSRTLSSLLNVAALKAARVRGMACHKWLLRRWHRSIAVEIWRRAASMILRCLPRPDGAEDWWGDAG